MFVGNGFDIHKHSKDENLILGGINIDGYGFEAHSDGDIVLHSLCDALLGSKAKKDLGYYFPSDETNSFLNPRYFRTEPKSGTTNHLPTSI